MASVFFLLFVIGQDASQAEVFFLKGIWEKAAAFYEEEVKSDPSAGKKRRLAEAYFHDGRLDESLKMWQEAKSSLDGEEAEIQIALLNALKTGKDEELFDLFDTHGENPLLMKALGYYNLRAGDWASALDYLEMASESAPYDYMIWFYKGRIYELREDFDNCIREYRKTVELNPRFAQALNNLGYCYKEKHYYTYAMDMYRKAIEENPDDAGYHYNIGNVYTIKEMIDEAFESYRKAVEIEPAFAKAHYNLGRTYMRYGLLAEAVKEFDLYIKNWDPSLSSSDMPDIKTVENEIIEIEMFLKEMEEEEKGIRHPEIRGLVR